MRASRSRGTAAVAALVTSIALAACAPAPARDVTIDPGRARAPGPNPSAGCGSSGSGGATTPGRSTVTVEGRSSLLTVPPALDEGGAPLLVSLHPFTLGPTDWEHYGGLADAAAARGYVVLSPLGSQPGPRWSVPGGLGGPFDVDDVGWVNRLVDQVSDDLCIDQNRVFAAGFSAGAAMAVTLGCAAPERFGAVAASGGANLTELCARDVGVDALILHGSADPIAPPSGSTVVFAPPLGLAVSAVVDRHAERAGCDPLPRSSSIGSIRVERYEGCGVHRVEYWNMLGAGHTWAGAGGIAGLPPEVAEWIVGPTNTDVDANEVVLDFFAGTSPP